MRWQLKSRGRDRQRRWRRGLALKSPNSEMSEEEDEEAATPQTTRSSHTIGPHQPMPPWGQGSNWWKGQPVRSHTQISLRASEATCQLLPIVGLVIEMWTVVHMEYDWGWRILNFFPRTGGEIRICWKTNSGLWPLLDSVHSCYVHWDTQLSLWIFVACSRGWK